MKLAFELVSDKEIVIKCCYFVLQSCKSVKHRPFLRIVIVALLLIYSSISTIAFAQNSTVPVQKKVKQASGRIEKGLQKDNPDTLAQGYYDLGETYYQNGELKKSETYFQKSKSLYEKEADAEGIAKSSRALAKVQEDLNKKDAARDNYTTAQKNSVISGNQSGNILNTNDVSRLSVTDTIVAENLLKENLKLGWLNKDTNEVISNYSRMGFFNLNQHKTAAAAEAFGNAYKLSLNIPEQARRYNQELTNVYLQDNDFAKAIETKKLQLNTGYVMNSTQMQAQEITSLADIYIKKKEDTAAVRLLHESYAISVRNGHTLEARASIVKLDSIFQSTGKKDKSLQLYKDFLVQLPTVISKDSSIADNRVVAETESKIKKLETEKALKDDLIRRKNVFNYWLMGSIIVLVLLIGVVLYTLSRLRKKNKKIALQSLRREMNPHFIFNSLNSINQFIANNNELEANQYLTKFSTLMRRVMENSKEDFVSFSKEIELLQNYLELEKSRFPDKFDFEIKIDDSLFAEEQLYVPGMLIQPHLENAIWHGLRYIEDKGFLRLSFVRSRQAIEIIIEDNGIGMAESKKNKTENQKKHSGRGITNTIERIRILNELYHQNITCEVQDKSAPDRGVKVKMTVPLLKEFIHED